MKSIFTCQLGFWLLTFTLTQLLSVQVSLALPAVWMPHDVASSIESPARTLGHLFVRSPLQIPDDMVDKAKDEVKNVKETAQSKAEDAKALAQITAQYEKLKKAILGAMVPLLCLFFLSLLFFPLYKFRRKVFASGTLPAKILKKVFGKEPYQAETEASSKKGSKHRGSAERRGEPQESSH